MATVSLKLSSKEIEELKKYIKKGILKEAPPTNEYELFRIKDQDVNIVVYTSFKVVHNGSDASKLIINRILEKEEGYDYILGSDETGKGEWYGPLIVVATALSPEDIIKLRELGVKDSKTIKKSQIMELASKLIKMKFERHSVQINPKKYNLRYAEFQREGKSLNDMMAWAHSKVIQELLDKIEFKKAKAVIDKFDFEKTEYRLEKVDKTNLEIIQKSGGESEIPVAAASIIAKYLFETEVDKLNDKYDIDLRSSKPEDINPEILSKVAKIHFKNVKKCIHN